MKESHSVYFAISTVTETMKALMPILKGIPTKKDVNELRKTVEVGRGQ